MDDGARSAGIPEDTAMDIEFLGKAGDLDAISRRPDSDIPLPVGRSQVVNDNGRRVMSSTKPRIRKNRRHIDVAIFESPWVSELDSGWKMFWIWCLLRADRAGFIKPNVKAAAYWLGIELDADKAEEKMTKQIQVYEDGYWRIKDYVDFQSGDLMDLSVKSGSHKNIMGILDYHYSKGRLVEGYPYATARVLLGYGEASDSLRGGVSKERIGKDKEGREEKNGEGRVRGDVVPYGKLRELFIEICGSYPRPYKPEQWEATRRAAVRSAYHRFEKEGKDPMMEFEVLFRKMEASDLMAGRSGGKRWGTFDFLMKPSNRLKVFEGNYDNAVAVGYEADEGNNSGPSPEQLERIIEDGRVRNERADLECLHRWAKMEDQSRRQVEDARLGLDGAPVIRLDFKHFGKGEGYDEAEWPEVKGEV